MLRKLLAGDCVTFRLGFTGASLEPGSQSRLNGGQVLQSRLGKRREHSHFNDRCSAPASCRVRMARWGGAGLPVTVSRTASESWATVIVSGIQRNLANCLASDRATPLSTRILYTRALTATSGGKNSRKPTARQAMRYKNIHAPYVMATATAASKSAAARIVHDVPVFVSHGPGHDDPCRARSRWPR